MATTVQPRKAHTVSLADKLANPPARVTPGRSILDTWVDALPETEQAAVNAAIINPAWGHVALLELLKAEGAPAVADTTFGDWRRKKGLPRESR